MDLDDVDRDVEYFLDDGPDWSDEEIRAMAEDAAAEDQLQQARDDEAYRWFRQRKLWGGELRLSRQRELPQRPLQARPHARTRRTRRVARTSGSRGDPPEPDLASRRVCLSSGRARGEA